ncbi:hypothetical protein UCDDA912_g08830 [Diaporthe ampelina]|uniref:Uncharacterized protein n=1 Tax=Diaporthe ampelina TaxID=1214573 RepID=A0A0G2F963_9PEZI|nr:hypothetical protein UCDDA912_g08830 [Diaporthe ampelina]
MIAGPLIHNARKKRQIIEHHMSIRSIEPETRNKDIHGPMGFSAALGGATMVFGSLGAEFLAIDTVTNIVSHAAIDAGVAAAEDNHSQREHEKETDKAGARIVLLEAIDETTLSELEVDLEYAVVEMDNPETWIDPVERGESGAAASPAATKRMSRTFELPADLDSLVRRHSTRFTRRSVQRGSSVRYSQYSFVKGEDKLSTASTATLRKPASQVTLRTRASSTCLLPSNPHSGKRAVQSHDDLTAESLKNHPYTHPLRRPSSNASLLPAYSPTDTGSAPAYVTTRSAKESHSPSPSIRGRHLEAWVDEKRRSVDHIAHSRHPSSLPFSPTDAYSPKGNWPAEEATRYQPQDHDLHTRQQQGRPSRGAPTAQHTAAHDNTNGAPNALLEPRPSSRGSPFRSTMHRSSSGSVSSALSRTGSMALSAHEGMKKVGYLGLEPATKLAVGGSLLMVGVRPSVQRRYLDKAGGKMGLRVEEKGNNGFTGMGWELGKGEEKQKRVNEDDDCRDYI